MCTLSVITRDGSYLLAMNRDERIARGVGELPEIHQVDGATAIYPSDGAGGTWIAANEYGIALALLNWNDAVPCSLDSSKIRSRGQIIPALGSTPSLAQSQAALGIFDLAGISPFRLVGVFPPEKTIGEWRWDSLELQLEIHSWESRHWFSSSLSDKQAGKLRGAACRNAQHEPDAGSAQWLRRLHASHAAGPGPFSLCVHRQDVKSLSYSEIMCMPEGVQMAHFRGSPCAMGKLHVTGIERKHGSDARAWEGDNLAV